MIVRIHRRPFDNPSQRRFRLQAAGLIALGVGVLVVWDPLTQPGPKVCLLRHAVGLPCPLCGMTRGVALCLRGHPFEAARFNPLAVPMLVLGMLLAIVWAIEFAMGRRFAVVVPSWLWRGLTCAFWGVVLASWAYMLIYRREDPFATTWLGQLWTNLTGGPS
jgi:hypothetical protein